MEIASYFESLAEFESEGTSLSSQIIMYSDSLEVKDFDLAIIYVPENRWVDHGTSDVNEIFNLVNLVIPLCLGP